MKTTRQFATVAGVAGALALPAFLLLLPAGGSVALAQGAAPDGKGVFAAQKCDMCHAVSTAGIEAKTKTGPMSGGDLVNVGSRHDADWIAKYVKKQVQKDGKDHKKLFSGTDPELAALVEWLLAQKK